MPHKHEISIEEHWFQRGDTPSNQKQEGIVEVKQKGEDGHDQGEWPGPAIEAGEFSSGEDRGIQLRSSWLPDGPDGPNLDEVHQ